MRPRSLWPRTLFWSACGKKGGSLRFLLYMQEPPTAGSHSIAFLCGAPCACPRRLAVFRDYDPNFVARSMDEAYLDITEACLERGLTGAQVGGLAHLLRPCLLLCSARDCSLFCLSACLGVVTESQGVLYIASVLLAQHGCMSWDCDWVLASWRKSSGGECVRPQGV